MRREKNVTRTRISKNLDTKTSNSTHNATENSTMQKISGNGEKAQTVWDTDEIIYYFLWLFLAL
jgi:hypothetical protein